MKKRISRPLFGREDTKCFDTVLKMATYPAREVLAAKLKAVCTSESACEALATKFAGQPVSCNHRVPQQAAFAVTSDAEEAAKCAAVLCSYVDTEGCRKK